MRLNDRNYTGMAKFFCLLVMLTTQAIASETIVISAGSTVAPYHYNSNTGFLDQLLIEAIKRTGKSLEIVTLPGERSLHSANDGVVDGDSNRIAGLEKQYPNLVPVPEKLFDWEFVAFSKKSIDLAAGWTALKSHTISYIIGWKIFESNLPHGTDALSVRNAELLFSLLENNRAELILYESWQGQVIVHDRHLSNVIMLSPPLAHQAKYLYLNKRHADLAPRIAEALREMKADGTYQRIFNNTLGHLKPQPGNP